MERFIVNLDDKVKWLVYYDRVFRDYSELKTVYPFACLIVPPTVKPSLISVTVIAVCKNIIDAVNGCPDDFTGEYSKKIHIQIPMEYWNKGCTVYGCKWFDEKKYCSSDVHLSRSDNKQDEKRYGYRMCVGTPASFKLMKNVLLEAVKTADNILVAYERVQRGSSKQVILNAYSHGDAGKKEHQKDRHCYISK